MTPRTRVLRALAEGIPARRATLEGIAEHHGCANAKQVIDDLIAEGAIVMIGERKGARYVLGKAAA